MAFNRKYFDLFKSLLPKSDAFSIIIQKNLTKFFESLTCIPDDFRNFVDNIYMDLFPNSTRFIDLWEKQFGIRIPSSDTAIRRSTIDLAWKLKGGQSAKYLQDKLQLSGFNVQVHENSPKNNPDIFLNSAYIMGCGMTTAVCGNNLAYAGRSGGYILVNGYIADSSDVRDYLAVCGGDGITDVCCGQDLAVCGYFEQFIIVPKISIEKLLEIEKLNQEIEICKKEMFES